MKAPQRPCLRLRAISLLTARISQLSTSTKRGTAARLVREVLLRVRAVLLSFDSRQARGWSSTRRLVLLIDPVAAGLWPHLRRRKGLSFPQRFARQLVIVANPSATEALREKDVQKILSVLLQLRKRFDRQTHSTPHSSCTEALPVKTDET
jgi:hypothetical protein